MSPKKDLLSELEPPIQRTEQYIVDALQKVGINKARCLHNLAISELTDLILWICVDTDSEKDQINQNKQLLDEFKKKLVEYGYPQYVIEDVHIDAESQETVNREAKGDWRRYFNKLLVKRLGIFERRKESELEPAIRRTEEYIVDAIQKFGIKKARCMHYGAIGLDPRHLVLWICVDTDTEKIKITQNKQLLDEFKRKLVEYGYPRHVIEDVHIGAESQETVDRESQGDWFHYFK